MNARPTLAKLFAIPIADLAKIPKGVMQAIARTAIVDDPDHPVPGDDLTLFYRSEGRLRACGSLGTYQALARIGIYLEGIVDYLKLRDPAIEDRLVEQLLYQQRRDDLAWFKRVLVEIQHIDATSRDLLINMINDTMEQLRAQAPDIE